MTCKYSYMQNGFDIKWLLILFLLHVNLMQQQRWGI